ncbi:MAG: DnaJ C-terminal domain-containing protein [Gemmatimonadota bacterium]
MDPRKNYYESLGVPENASADDIRKAFRRLAKKHHPDVNPGNRSAEAKFKEINEAHEVLSDAKKRAEYDAVRKGAFAGWGGAGQQADPSRGDRFRWPGGSGGFGRGGPFRYEETVDFGDIIGDLLRGQGDFRRAAPGSDLSLEVEVDFLDMARGAVKEVAYGRPRACPSCGGTGRSGRRGCADCLGAGVKPVPETIRVKIPAGARDGATIRVPGKGGEGGQPGAAGDLLIRLKTIPHPYFRRSGSDILVDVPVNYSEAVNGAKVTVPTIDGPVTVSVPPGSTSGVKLRLKGKGVPVPGKTGRGDQYAVLHVVVPGTRADDFLKLVERLKAFEDPDVRKGWK